MKRFESNVQYIKYLVNREVAGSFFRGSMEEKSTDFSRKIAEKIIPGPKAMFRCCIYKERNIIEDRVRLLLNSKEEKHMIMVLNAACDECPIDRFVVTEACRGCLGHKCQEVCLRNAITIIDHRAYIDQNVCIECGRCKNVCPFNGISEVMRPCIRSCAVGAVKVDEGRKAVIDQDKCISCGACIYQCPFGAIVDKSFILDALNLLNNSWSNTNYHVYAVVSPAIASQFPSVKMGQVFAGIKELGFYEVVEAAIGGDMVTLAEAHNLKNGMQQKAWKASSHCPAFVEYVRKNYPEQVNHLSTVVSPMIAISRGIRQKDTKAKVIYIGSCTAKKVEISQEDIQGVVDYVITFEELQALLDAKEIDLDSLDELSAGYPSSFGRIYGRSGGITESICHVMQEVESSQGLKSVLCNGIDQCIKAMKLASSGRVEADFLEAIACKDGCAGGTASLTHDDMGVERIDNFSRTSVTGDPHLGIKGYSMEYIQMHRTYKEVELQKQKYN